ncbi:MAG: HEAT repeat domain-containing protein [Phycisphaerae bacterium]
MKDSSRKIIVLPACAVLSLAVCGCGDALKGMENAQREWTLQKLLKKLSGRTPTENVAMAFDPNDPDLRRDGILGLSRKDWGLKEPYLKGYAAILRTDDDPLVRSAAVRALGKAKDPNYIEDVARSLFDPVAFVRQDAAAALDGLIGDVAVDPLRNRAVNDTDQDVRANCAKALRHYRRNDVVRTLAECMSDKAFSVRYQAHGSLVAVAGRDLGYDPQDWAGVALEGLPPKEPEKEPDSWWDRLWRGLKKPAPKPAASPDG